MTHTHWGSNKVTLSCLPQRSDVLAKEESKRNLLLDINIKCSYSKNTDSEKHFSLQSEKQQDLRWQMLMPPPTSPMPSTKRREPFFFATSFFCSPSSEPAWLYPSTWHSIFYFDHPDGVPFPDLQEDNIHAFRDLGGSRKRGPASCP